MLSGMHHVVFGDVTLPGTVIGRFEAARFEAIFIKQNDLLAALITFQTQPSITDIADAESTIRAHAQKAFQRQLDFLLTRTVKRNDGAA